LDAKPKLVMGKFWSAAISRETVFKWLIPGNTLMAMFCDAEPVTGIALYMMQI
jgi:hypothetical protein